MVARWILESATVAVGAVVLGLLLYRELAPQPPSIRRSVAIDATAAGLFVLVAVLLYLELVSF